MNYAFTKVLHVTFFLMLFFNAAFAQECTLIGPEVNILETTESTITVDWEPVDGAVMYQLNLYLSETDELIQQVQTEELSYTFDGLTDDTFYDIGAQAGCDAESFGPESYQRPKAHTGTGLVIVVDDFRIDTNDPATGPCGENRVYESKSFGPDSTYTPLASLQVGKGILMDISITGSAPNTVIGEYFRIIVFENINTNISGNLLIGVLQNYTSSIYVHQSSNAVFIRDTANPNRWHFVCHISDTLLSNNVVEIDWAMSVNVVYDNCVDYWYHIPTGQQLVAQVSTTVSSTNALAYPNPVADVLTVEFPAEGIGFQIMDVTGKVWHQTISEQLRAQVDVSNWPSGTYILRYEDQSVPRLQRIIKL